MQVLFFPEHRWIIGFEIAAMVGVFGLWLSGRRQAWHEKWLRYRYLAERLRSATFTTLLGRRRQEPAADPLPYYRGPQEWLAHTVDALVTTASRSVAALPLEPLKAFVRDVLDATADLMMMETHEWWVLLSFQDIRLQA